MTSFWDSAAGDCSNLQSPQVVPLVPEPDDYFMICSQTLTNTCLARCFDEIQAFEFAQAMASEPPNFVLCQNIAVESLYFSTDDIEHDLHLAQFEVFSLLELRDCSKICTGRQYPQDRCLAVAGKTLGEQTVIAYYCVPSDIFWYVSLYPGLQYPTTTVEYVLSLRK